jgi:uncharacterized protein YjbI with pentapeptide repeats
MSMVPTSPEEWRQYWQTKGFPWRTEPEIDAKRQKELSECRAIVPDDKKEIYPFKGMKLNRADVEWLLATHENGRGPVNWNDEAERQGTNIFAGVEWPDPFKEARLSRAEIEQRIPSPKRRKGLDLRGADLSQVDLGALPLTCLWGDHMLLEETNLSGTKLEGADLTAANLKGASLWSANLEVADLTRANLEGADLGLANLEGADLTAANLRRARLGAARLNEADLSEAKLEGANLKGASLIETNLSGARLEGANLREVGLGGETLLGPQGPRLNVKGPRGPQLADVQWGGGTNLTVVDWSQMTMLGDEYKARGLFETAIRANRQLAVALQAQGLNEDAARFAYRAQILRRKVLWKERAFGQWLFSWLLALLAGYGYRMGRILIAYLFVVLLCAVAYFVLGMYYEPHLSFLEAVLTSVTAFHGRVFSEPFLRPGEPQLWVTAFEAVAGLVIEGVFIAMLTQKFFGK